MEWLSRRIENQDYDGDNCGERKEARSGVHCTVNKKESYVLGKSPSEGMFARWRMERAETMTGLLSSKLVSGNRGGRGRTRVS